MLFKFAIILILASSAYAQTSLMICSLEVVDNLCTCNFVIMNGNGQGEIPIIGNPIDGCSLNNVSVAKGIGITQNVPGNLCIAMPELETLVMPGLTIDNLKDNPFQRCSKLKTLDLSGNLIDELTPLTFANTKLQELFLGSNQIKQVANETFNSLGDLRVLDLSNNSQIFFNSTVFNQLVNLTSLILNDCNIETLNTEWFANLGNLIKLNLSKNEIEEINPTTFAPLTRLANLDISFNVIDEIIPTTFTNNSNLLVLNLSNNKLSELAQNTFSNQIRLVSLSLSGNDFVSGSDLSTLKPLEALQNLEMSGCAIDDTLVNTIPSLGALVKIDLSDNSIADIPEGLFSATDNLVDINLSNNNISVLNSKSFGSLRSLTNIEFYNNSIDAVDHHFINQSLGLKTVNFLSNGCSQINTNAFTLDKENYMKEMKSCFDNFDSKPIKRTTENNEVYEWFNIRPEHGWEAIRVKVKAPYSAHVGLSDVYDSNALIEIRFGEQYNHETHILERGQIVFNDLTINRLNATDEKSFLIGWGFNILLVFAENNQLPFMAHAIKEHFPVNFFGIRSLIGSNEAINTAEWEVQRVDPASVTSMNIIYRDIQAKLKMGKPLNLKKYLS